jgi:hypothetical protein
MDPPPRAPSLVSTLPARQHDTYSIDVRTISDKTLTSYQIVATTAIIGNFTSHRASGYSLDNLAPAAPQNFAPGPPTSLTWDPAPEPDFDHFTLYGSDWDWLDGSAVVIAATIGTSYYVWCRCPFMTFRDGWWRRWSKAITAKPATTSRIVLLK